jgi:hypothetical protein
MYLSSLAECVLLSELCAVCSALKTADKALPSAAVRLKKVFSTVRAGGRGGDCGGGVS